MRMHIFIIRRLILLIPVLIGVTMFVFILTRMAGPPYAAYINPDKPATPEQIEAIKEQYHLNEGYIEQYIYYLKGLLQGDWGWARGPPAEPVTDKIVRLFPATFELAMVSMFIAVFIGIALGTVSAVRRNTPTDHFTRIIALSGVCLPIFILGLLLQYVFAYQLGWFPFIGRFDTNLYLESDINHYTGFLLVDTLLNLDWIRFKDAVWHLMLPAITLAFGTIALLTRIMRGSMLEVLSLDYVKTARSKGLPEKVVIKRHARKNALIPTITVVGLAFGALLGGAVLTESVFTWPGLGGWAASATLAGDSNSILGFTIITAIIFVLFNLLVDILYAHFDPRIKLE